MLRYFIGAEVCKDGIPIHEISKTKGQIIIRGTHPQINLLNYHKISRFCQDHVNNSPNALPARENICKSRNSLFTLYFKVLSYE